MDNNFDLAMSSMLAGFKSCIDRSRATMQPVFYGQGAIDNHKNIMLPAVLLQWGEGSSPQISKIDYDQNTCQEKSSRLLEFSSMLEVYSKDHQTQPLYFLEVIAQGLASETFQQAFHAELETHNIKSCEIQSLSKIVQANKILEDDTLLFMAHGQLQWHINSEVNFGKLPQIGKNRQDRIITFVKQGAVFKATATFTNSTLDFQPNTNNYKLVFTKKTANEPIEMLVNNNPYMITKISEKEFESLATVAPEDRITDQSLTQTINFKLKDNSFLYEFDTAPVFRVENTITKKTQDIREFKIT